MPWLLRTFPLKGWDNGLINTKLLSQYLAADVVVALRIMGLHQNAHPSPNEYTRRPKTAVRINPRCSEFRSETLHSASREGTVYPVGTTIEVAQIESPFAVLAISFGLCSDSSLIDLRRSGSFEAWKGRDLLGGIICDVVLSFVVSTSAAWIFV